MENTANTIKNQNNKLTGIWYIEGNIAYRYRKSEFKVEDKPEIIIREIPITEENREEILYQIEQQDIARDLFEGFKKITDDNINLIGYLHRILRDVLNFLDDERKKELISRIENIKNSNYLDENNKIFLKYITNALKENKFNIFMEIFEDFEKYNETSLIQPLTETQTSEIHR